MFLSTLNMFMYLSNLDCTEIAILKEVISNTRRIQSWFGIR